VKLMQELTPFDLCPLYTKETIDVLV